MRTLLIVEDEMKILRAHKRFFTKSGYSAITAENAARARKQLAAHTPDAILLDIMLPDGNGLELLSEWRAAGCKLPIIMLTAWGEPQDISRGYRLGATAYLSKPFEYEAVLSVLDGIFSAAEKMPEQITRGGLTLKLMSYEAFVNGVSLSLTQKEFSLLMIFVQNEEQTMNTEYLYERIWGQPMGADDNAIKVTISKLRGKLKDSGFTITGKRGDGYRFEKEKAPAILREG